MKKNPKQTAELLAQAVSQCATPHLFAVFNNTLGADEDIDMDAKAEMALMEATIGRG